jgi:transmembrane sensor
MAGSAQIERRAAAWLARRDADGWSREDQAALDAWLQASTAHRVAFLRLEAAWRRTDRLKVLGAGRADPMPPARGQWRFAPLGQWPPAASAQASHERSAPSGPAPNRRRLLRGVLAAAACMALAALLWPAWQRQRAVERASYATTVGVLREVALSDGSRITLSSDSRVQVSYASDGRDIELERGEAFFEVAKDPTRPFTVAAGGRRAIAVGTRFGVRRDAADLRVVVTEGVVRLEAGTLVDGRRQPVTLLPAGSIALASSDGVTVQAGSVAQAEDQLSWRSGFLVFHETPLAAAAAEFNRYSARRIIVADAAAGALRIGGNFRWSNAEAFVRLLQQGFPVRVEERGDAIVVRHK